MHRLCRFYISDIKAGDNILRNGYFPISRDETRLDHGVIFAANGTCKTTMLSFILSAFCPDQRRFVQHLQSGGDKTLAQYLVPGRPAIVLLDLAAATGQLKLFEPLEHALIGQLLYRHKSAANKLERTYFIAEETDFFDQVRGKWDTLLGEGHPYAAVREFVHPHVKQTTSQKEWEDTLERVGLDPWLINRQIDFARGEGSGIRDAFRFRSESDFLSFFLNCVTDLDAAMKLRQFTDRSLQKMKDRPKKAAQMNAARELKKRISDFDQTAEAWRDSRETVEETGKQIGEGAHLLAKARTAAEQRKNELGQALEEVKITLREVKNRMDAARANIAKVRRCNLEREAEEVRDRLESIAANIDASKNERNAIKAARWIAEILEMKTREASQEKILAKAGSDLKPVRRETRLRSVQFHFRIDHERARMEEKHRSVIRKLKEREEALLLSREQVEKVNEQLNAVLKELGSLESRIESANEVKGKLPLQSHETPAEGLGRIRKESEALKGENAEDDKRIGELGAKIDAAKETIETCKSKIGDLRVSLGLAREKRDEEMEQRKTLQADRNLKSIAGADTFEPAGAELLSRLDETITRNREAREAVGMESASVRKTVSFLKKVDSLAVTEEVRDFIDHCLERGLTPGELKPFPDYLAALYEDPEEIAEFIENDPGRFTGVMAATPEVVARVRDIPAPEDLTRPIVISTPCAREEISPIDSAVVVPGDPHVYTHRRLVRRMADLNKKIETLDREGNTLGRRIQSLEISRGKLEVYRGAHPDRSAVEALSQRVERFKERERRLKDDVGKMEEKAVNLTREKDALGQRISKRNTDLARFKEWCRRIEDWIEQFGDMEQWVAERSKMDELRLALSTEIQRTREKIEKIEAEKEGLVKASADAENTLKNLDKEANLVPRCSDISLEENKRSEALSLGIRNLKTLFDDARDMERRKAGELGVESLRKDLERFQKSRQEAGTNLTGFRRKKEFDEEMAAKWASHSAEEQAERNNRLDAVLEELQVEKGRCLNREKPLERELALCRRELEEMAINGIRPHIDDAEIRSNDPEVLRLRFENEMEQREEKHLRLDQRFQDLKAKFVRDEKWTGEIELSQALTTGYSPDWDDESPRLEWPELVRTEDRPRAVSMIQRLLKDLVNATRENEARVETARRRMSRAFDALQRNLRDDRLRAQLPAIIDELGRYDAESLGGQSRDLMEKCENIARNIEADLARFEGLFHSFPHTSTTPSTFSLHMFPRESRVHMADRMASTIIGARRAGKRFRALQAASEMISQGAIQSTDHICPLDFDNPVLSNMKAREKRLS